MSHLSKKMICLLLISMVIISQSFAQFPGGPRLSPADSIARRRAQDSVRQLTENDHKQMMAQLNITSIRPGANGSDPKAPNAANYDESKANPFPTLPDPLVLKNGKKVTTEKMWWNQRRPEIVEDFDSEIYGRVPKNTPTVNWEVN